MRVRIQIRTSEALALAATARAARVGMDRNGWIVALLQDALDSGLEDQIKIKNVIGLLGRRREALSIDLEDAMRDEIDRLAREAGVSRSSWINIVLAGG